MLLDPSLPPAPSSSLSLLFSYQSQNSARISKKQNENNHCPFVLQRVTFVDSSGQMYVENVVKNQVWMLVPFVYLYVFATSQPYKWVCQRTPHPSYFTHKDMVGEPVTCPWSHSTRIQASRGSKASFQGYFASVTCRGDRVVCWTRWDIDRMVREGSLSRWQWADFKQSRGFVFIVVSPFPGTRPVPCEQRAFHRYWLNELIGEWRSYSWRHLGVFGNVFAITTHAHSSPSFALIMCQAHMLNDFHFFKTWILTTIQRTNYTTSPFFR